MLLRRAGLTASAGLSCYKKVIENCHRQHCQRMRNAYLHPANIDVSVKHLRNFCINKNKMVISREDRMLVNILHQEKGFGSKKLLAEFPNRAFEMIPTVFIVLETCIFTRATLC